MAKKNINIVFSEYSSTNELSKGLIELINQAESVLPNAYAPYSNFHVSALCLLGNGETVSGTNQENAAYPSGLCAERVAIFAAKSRFPEQDIEKIIITTKAENASPFTPCGACRQVLIEYENAQNQPIEVILKSGNSKIWKFSSISDLLPFAFNGATILKKG